MKGKILDISHVCSVSECCKEHFCKGFCKTHYHRFWRYGDPLAFYRRFSGKCSVAGCDQKHYRKSFCMKHYYRFHRHGDPLYMRINRGSGKKMNNGYIQIYQPNHPCADNAGYVFEHRLVMEHCLGRHLTKNEVVHHKNGVKTDNVVENLEIMSRGKHASISNNGKRLYPLKSLVSKYESFIKMKELWSECAIWLGVQK